MKTLLTIALLLFASVAAALDPAVYDMTMQAGEDFRLNLTLKDGNSTAMNVTGYTYKAQFRSAPYPGGSVFANFSSYVTTPTTGGVTVRLSKSQTTALSTYTGFWDLQQTALDGSVSYILTGRCLVKATVTR